MVQSVSTNPIVFPKVLMAVALAAVHPIRRRDVLDELVAAGLQARLLASYGRAWRFRRGHAGILAIKPTG